MSSTIANPPLTEEERMQRYGYREIVNYLPNGRVVFDRAALTLEDLLHPQMGDFAVESSLHDQERHYRASVFRSQLEDDPSGVLVLSDCGVYWDDPALKHHSPDVAVIFNIREKRANWTSFQVAEQGVRPRLIVEIVSPEYRANDVVTKVDQYFRAGVKWYVIVDREKENDPPQIIARRYRPEGWEIVSADEQGRIWLQMIGVWLAVKDGRVVCFDGVTGEALGDYSAVRRELKEKDALREMLETQMEVEIDTRQKAEARANAETARANAEVETRRSLEEKIAALEAELTLALRVP